MNYLTHKFYVRQATRNQYLLIVFFLTCFIGYGQQYNYVEVDDTYTPEELVKDVLVRSKCDLVSNVKYQNGDGTPQAQQYYNLAYFEKNGSTFPFEDGVVLCTDSPDEIPGPFSGGYTSGVNNERWTGDQDLNDAINDAGGGAATQFRSTQLQFDFIPVQPTVTFEYLFASNSYHRNCGTWCQNGAMFAAWLIDTTTGVGENLAKVPNTNDPISVNTVRDTIKSGTNALQCASINEQYMGDVYVAPGTSLPLSAPISYIGHTIPMTSITANVIIGRKYTIKLAVIDFCPAAGHSSAVFFKAGSFDLGSLD